MPCKKKGGKKDKTNKPILILPLFRLYLINSPVVKADTLRFKEEGVKDVIKDVFLPWYNAYRFFMQNIERLFRVNKEIKYTPQKN